MFRIYSLIIFLLVLTPVFAENDQTALKLGHISFPNSGNQSAQGFFITGVLYLHNFEYELARKYFQKSEHADPDFALAYWGEAMTYNQPLWNQQDLTSARKILEKLASTNDQRISKARDPREKGFIHAVNLLFGQGNKPDRDFSYAKAMADLYQKFPEDNEIKSFYALSLLGVTEGERDLQFYMKAAALVESILQSNPQHPGALHYLIHAYDDPTHAPLGLRAAEIYSTLAPDASHAMHMPSHIYYALGMWDEVIRANKSAWEAGVKNNVSNDARNFTIHDFHALQWLAYGYLQKGEYQKAYQLVKDMGKIAENSNLPIAKFHYALMRSAYVMESNDWSADLKEIDMQGMEPASFASTIYVNALILLHSPNKNLSQINRMASSLRQISNGSPHKISSSDHHDYFTIATPPGILIAKITNMELQAQIMLHKGKLKDAILIAQQAARLEDTLRIGYGPPTPIKPAHELLADLLFLNKQYTKAHQEYLNELKIQPNRRLSVQGLKASFKKSKELGLQIPIDKNELFLNK